jgi:hypothetical protein
MAQVNVNSVIDHLGPKLRRALARAVADVLPDAEFDERELFRAFKRAVARKCYSREAVPDHYVQSGA